MPTLEGIQGTSLQPRVDIVDLLKQGSQAGEEIRRVRNQGAADRTQAAAAREQLANPDRAAAGDTSGAAGGAGAPPGQGAMAQLKSGGGVNPDRPSFDPLQQLQRAQTQLMQFGAPGAKAAENIGLLRDQAQKRVDDATSREAQAIGSVAGTLLQTPFNDRAVLIDQMARNTKGDPQMEKFVTQLKAAKTADEQDFLLNRWQNKALSVKDSIAARQNQQKIDQLGEKGNTEVIKAATAQESNQIKRDTLNQRIKEHEEEPGRANVDVKREWVAEAGTIARENVAVGMELRSVIDQQKRILGEITQLQDGNVPLGVRQAIVDKMAILDPSMGVAAQALLDTPSAKNITRLKANASKLTGSILNQMEKPSDRDLALAWDQTSSVWNQDTDTMAAVLDDMSELVDGRLDSFTEIGRSAVKAMSGKGTEADMDAVLNSEAEDYDKMKFIDEEVAKAQRIIQADPTKRDVIEEYFRKVSIDTRYLDYGLPTR